MREKRSRVNPSLIISIVALFVALGGGAYAALGPNSVGSTQLKKGAVATEDLRNGAVTAAKIRANSIGSRHLRNKAVGPRKISGQLPGTLVAYALVTPDGVVESKSKGIDDSNVSQLPLSQYCFSDLPPHETASVTPASNGQSVVIANLELPPASMNSCGDLDGSSDHIAVTTMTGINAAPLTWSFQPFYIYLYR